MLLTPADLTPEIAAKTKHSKEAVDRYIADYHRVEILWKHGITSLEEISRLSRLSKRVAQQYVDLLPEKVRPQKTTTRKNEQALPVDSTDGASLLKRSGGGGLCWGAPRRGIARPTGIEAEVTAARDDGLCPR